MIRRWWLVISIAFAPLVHVHAQDDPSFRASAEGTVFYGSLATNGLYVRSVARQWVLTGDGAISGLLDALKTSWVDTSGDTQFTSSDICGVVIGMGGTPRIDGGGGLGQLESPFSETDLVSAGSFSAVVGSAFPNLAIIDEFELGSLSTALSAVRDEDGTGLDAVVNTAAVLRSGFTAEPDPGASVVGVVHGHLVLHHVLSILSAKGGTIDQVQDAENGQPMVLSLTVDGLPLEVRLYHIGFVRLDGLQEALDDIVVGQAAGAPPLAVIMSWGMTGCALEAAYARPEGDAPPRAQNGSRIQTVVEYLYDSIARLEDGRTIVAGICDELEQFRARRARDPDRWAEDHRVAIGCAEEDLDTVATIVALAQFESLAWAEFTAEVPLTTEFFAAAGNEMLPFAMPPASFDSVVAVAACSPTRTEGTTRAWFSNAGTVTSEGEAVALGAWFAAPQFAGLPDGAGYWGTSFAAPLAAIASLDRLTGSASPAPGSAFLWPNEDALCSPFIVQTD